MGGNTMADVIQVIGDRVKYWAQINNPSDGPGTFRKDKSNLRAEFKTLQYGNLYPHNFRPVTLQTSTYINRGSLPNKQTFSVDKKTTSTFSYTFKESIETKLTSKINIPIVGEGGLELTLNFESTQSQTTEDARTWTYSTEINIAPHKRVETSFIVEEGQYDVPFTAKVQVRGLVYIEFKQTNKHFAREISRLMELGWNPTTFDYDVTGIFEAVHGAKYIVTVDEFDLEEPDRAAVHSVIDSGAIYFYSDFGELLLQRED
jgi:Clostridium epsilon toxin ETX/Bacillus mosquitocidal toxin MTX2